MVLESVWSMKRLYGFYESCQLVKYYGLFFQRIVIDQYGFIDYLCGYLFFECYDSWFRVMMSDYNMLLQNYFNGGVLGWVED